MSDGKECAQIFIEAAKLEGEYTLSYEKNKKKKYILSKYRPQIDAQKGLEEDYGNKDTLWIIFGFIFGYTLKPILDKIGEYGKIIVIEPDYQLYHKQLTLSEYKELVNKKNVTIFTGSDFDTMQRIFNQEITVERLDNIKLVYVEEYNKAYVDYFTRVSKMINDIKNIRRINQVTYNEYVEDITINLIKNIEYINGSYDIRQHKNKYKHIPAVIVSAGPSLNKNIHFLKEFKGMVFTGGRTLEPILGQGVQPDFLASLDPGEIAYDLLGKYGDNTLPLITIAQSNYQIALHNRGPQYFVETHQQFIKTLLDRDFEALDVNGSVALLCLTAAQYMGCNPIIFIGQDLAYTDNKIHQGDSNIQINLHTNDNTVKVKGYDGGTMLADISWKLFKDEIERIIAQHASIKFYNCTEGGAYIEGAEHRPFKEIVDLYQEIEKIQINHILPNKENQIDASQLLIKELKNLEIWKSAGERGLSAVTQLREEYLLDEHSCKDIVDANIKIIEDVDKQLSHTKTVLGEYVFGNLYNIINMQTRYKETFNETEIERGLRTSELKMCIYNAIKQAAIKNIEWIKEELER